jgi:hypothetical protein
MICYELSFVSLFILALPPAAGFLLIPCESLLKKQIFFNGSDREKVGQKLLSITTAF